MVAHILRVFVVIIGCAVIFTAFDMPVTDAYAQSKTTTKSKKSVFSIFFKKKPQQKTKAKTKKKKSTKRRTTASRKKTSSSSSKKVANVTKTESAQVVLVMGDFIAGGLADGLVKAYQKSPNIVVKEKTKGASTIVKQSYYDWQVKSVEWITQYKPNLVVFNIGASDRQDMRVDGKWLDFGSDAWWVEYRKRVANLAKTMRAQSVPLIWVGVPAFKYSKMSADILKFNGIYREEVEKVGGVFVDIWEGFVDLNGKFIYTGSDINGQQVRLRSSDGINLTSAGKRKMAFYVEKPAARFLSQAGTPLVGDLNETEIAALQGVAAEDLRLLKRTRVYAFTDPDLDGGDYMLGGQAKAAKFEEKSPLDQLVESGELASAPLGRVDNFAWKISPAEPLRLSTQPAPSTTSVETAPDKEPTEATQ